jgi:hypothetical protein
MDGRVYRAAFAVAFVSLGAIVALGIQDIVTPDPKPIIRTITTSTPPCVTQMADAGRAERAHRDTADQHADLVAARSAERYDAELTADEDTIADAAKALDTELRLEQAALTDLASAQAAFDVAAEQCLEVSK